MRPGTVVLVCICAASLVLACAIDPGPFFEADQRPENEAEFLKGQLGLITPSLNKADELIAFRYLSGLTFDDPEVIHGLQASTTPAADVDLTGTEVWMKTRREVSDPPASGYIDPYRTSRSSTPYVFYENCLNDAFVTAARTFADRRQSYDGQSAFLDWVHAQDQVFANCSGEKSPVYPEDPPAGGAELIRADRGYQIAAAHFYAQDLDTAEKLFRTIAEDKNSPWAKVSDYMVGRTLLREVSLQNNAAASDAARRQFQKIADDASAGSLRDSARGLLQHLKAMEHSAEVFQTLSEQLMAPHPSASFSDTLGGARYVLLADSFRQARSQAELPEPFDWVQTLESENAPHALDRLRAVHSLPWLTLALVCSRGKDASAAELITEADHLSSPSPAFATATYNAIRLRMERDEKDQARQQLDALLAKEVKQPPSVINAWRAERMQLATSFDDFLHWAPRIPIYASAYSRDPNAASPVLAQDSAYLLNYRTPLSKLAEAAHSQYLPQWSAEDVALAAWTRAFMLRNRTVMKDVAPILVRAHPDWAGKLVPPSEPEFDAWSFRAALLIAHSAEFQPLVPVDYRKHLERGSWWCPVSPPDTHLPANEGPNVAWRLPAVFQPSEAVISKAERDSAEQEIRKLRKTGSAQALVGDIILGWAKSHPQDPLVPEALHRVVMVVRYGCHQPDPQNGRISKAAFDLLHEYYPKNNWTMKTPYWFN
jgi:hypothetical protein